MIDAVVIGVSAGGLEALTTIIPPLPKNFGKAIIVVQHIKEYSDDFTARHLDAISAIQVKEADEKEVILPSTVYIAPAGYHLLVEDDRTFSLSAEPPVNFARPSIDVLLESASEVYADRLLGIILTGANSDGAHGLRAVKMAGGLTLVQDPKTAEFDTMPLAAINATKIDHVLELPEIASFLSDLDTVKNTHRQCHE
jgi:two-component system chemotaxis response regulator CheB